MAHKQARVAEHAAPHQPAHEPDHEAETVPVEKRKRTRQLTNASALNSDPIIYGNVPPDVSLEWKRFSVSGQPLEKSDDPFYIEKLRLQGWEPVNPREHPDWVALPPGYNAAMVIKDGLILMERPKELTADARAETEKQSKQQVREAEQRLGMTPKDTLTRQHAGVEPKITKEMMRPVAIEE